MKMRLVIAQTIVGVTALIAFAGCGKSAPPASDEGTAPGAPAAAAGASADSTPAAPSTPNNDVEKFVDGVAENEDVPEIVAKIGDITVTREDYLDAIRTMQRLQAAASIMKNGATERRAELLPLNLAQKQKILDTYIDGRIIERLVEREGITASDEEVDQRMREGRENLMTEENYQDYLKWSQTDEGKLKDQVRKQIVQEKYRDIVSKDCTVTDAEVSDEYERQIILGKMDHKATMDFWQVLKRVAPGSSAADWEAAKQAVLDAKVRVEGGANIGDVAREISDDPKAKANGGLYEKVDPAELPGAIGETLSKLAAGGLSGPVQTSYGWVLLQLKDQREAGRYTLDEVKDRVRDFVLNRCRQNLLADKVAQIKQESGIEVYYQPLIQTPQQ